MRIIIAKIVQVAQRKKETERDGYIHKANKRVGDIGKRDFILFVKLKDENRKQQWHNQQKVLQFVLEKVIAGSKAKNNHGRQNADVSMGSDPPYLHQFIKLQQGHHAERQVEKSEGIGAQKKMDPNITMVKKNAVMARVFIKV